MTTTASALKWMKNKGRENTWQSKAKRVVLANTIYHIWTSRNKLFFEDLEMRSESIVRWIKTHVYKVIFSSIRLFVQPYCYILDDSPLTWGWDRPNFNLILRVGPTSKCEGAVIKAINRAVHTAWFYFHCILMFDSVRVISFWSLDHYHLYIIWSWLPKYALVLVNM